MQPGEIFQQRYRIQSEVGRGSFGIVYAADDLTAGRPVAVKVLLPWIRNDASLQHRLKREAKLTRMLKSPHAVRVYDLEETAEGDLYIVMELLEGQELSQLLAAEGRLRPERAREIARQVLDALSESHALGVIHRDLKPHNIFVCRGAATAAGESREFVKVLDFGIAKVAGTEDGGGLSETTRLTAPGGVVGTPAYMSPEQCRGETFTPASDFYSLGIVLYEMVVGRVPFDDPNPVQTLLLHNMQPPPPLPAAVAQTPLGLAIARALEKDPRARFRSAAEFMTALGYASIGPSSPPAAPQSPTAAPLPQVVVAPIAAPTSVLPAAPREAPRRKPASLGLSGLIRRYWLPAVVAILLAILAASYFILK